MPRDPQVLVFVGISDSVVALDARSGAAVWRAKLRGSDYVNVYWDGEVLVAANAGEVWRLDPANGSVIWHNELKGMGRRLVSLATSRTIGGSTRGDPSAEKYRRDAEAAAAESA